MTDLAAIVAACAALAGRPQLECVHQRVDAAITYQRTASWRPSTSAGDCKTYAVTKRAALLALGWSPDALAVREVWTERGERHAVLTVTGGSGRWVLDQRFAWTQSPDDLTRYGYRWGATFAPWLLELETRG